MSHTNVNEEEHLPVFAPFEVILHNERNDCWVSLLGYVYDITPVLEKCKHPNLVKPLLAFAGKDISHWFDDETGEVRHRIDPTSGIRIPYCPYGPFVGISPGYNVPSTRWRPCEELPWWKDKSLIVGRLSKSVRTIKIINTIICKEVLLKVCCEDTFERIRERYSIFNSDGDSYTWVYNGEFVDMLKTLDENGIVDETEIFLELGIPASSYIPAIFLYYNDDMKYYLDSDSDDTDYDCL